MGTLVGLPCPFCHQPRPTIRTYFCGEGGCDISEEVWPCDCGGGAWQLRADLIEEDGHTRECAEATAKAWMESKTTVNCALDCGRPYAGAS